MCGAFSGIRLTLSRAWQVTPLERTATRLRLLVEPLVYGCDGVPAWFHVVQTLELQDNALWVTAQLQAVAPPPPGLAGTLLQELPSVFVNPLLDRLVTYTGVSPFQEDRVESIPAGYSLKNQSWTPGPFMAAENWAALVCPPAPLARSVQRPPTPPPITIHHPLINRPRCVPHCAGVPVPGGGGLRAQEDQEVQGAVGPGHLPSAVDRLRRRLPVCPAVPSRLPSARRACCSVIFGSPFSTNLL